MTFQDAESRYRDLRRQYKAGEITSRQFKDAVKGLRLRDSAGKWWQVSVHDGGWLLWDGNRWAADSPSEITRRGGASGEEADRPGATRPTPPAERLAVDPSRASSWIAACQAVFASFRAARAGRVPAPKGGWATLEATAEALAALDVQTDPREDDGARALRRDHGSGGFTYRLSWNLDEAGRESFTFETDGAGALLMALTSVEGTSRGSSRMAISPRGSGWEVRYPMQAGRRVAVSSDGRVEALPPLPGSSRASIHCPACGARRRLGKAFCPQCGRPIESESGRETERRCRRCGSELDPREGFCPCCGSPVEQGAVLPPLI